METNNKAPAIITRWIKISINIDIETGEKISITERNKNYTIIKKTKRVHYENNTGIIEYSIECRRKPEQGRLEYTDNNE